MKIIVLGAGVIGVATAWQLLKDGHQVTVVDRAGGPAQLTSFGNAGLNWNATGFNPYFVLFRSLDDEDCVPYH